MLDGACVRRSCGPIIRYPASQSASVVLAERMMQSRVRDNPKGGAPFRAVYTQRSSGASMMDNATPVTELDLLVGSMFTTRPDEDRELLMKSVSGFRMSR